MFIVDLKQNSLKKVNVAEWLLVAVSLERRNKNSQNNMFGSKGREREICFCGSNN